MKQLTALASVRQRTPAEAADAVIAAVERFQQAQAQGSRPRPTS